jgi:hypothetical protein
MLIHIDPFIDQWTSMQRVGIQYFKTSTQCCGSGIRCLFDSWIGDSGWVKNQDPDPGSGSGMNIPDHISESLETIFRVKILKFFDADADPNPGKFLTLDP